MNHKNCEARVQKYSQIADEMVRLFHDEPLTIGETNSDIKAVIDEVAEAILGIHGAHYLTVLAVLEDRGQLTVCRKSHKNGYTAVFCSDDEIILSDESPEAPVRERLYEVGDVVVIDGIKGGVIRRVEDYQVCNIMLDGDPNVYSPVSHTVFNVTKRVTA